MAALLLSSAAAAQKAPVAPGAAASAASAPVSVEANHIGARPDVDVVAEGSVVLKQGLVELRADRLSFQQATGLARAEGNVVLIHGMDRYSGPELQLYIDRFEGFFANPTYYFSLPKAGGTAERLEFFNRDEAMATRANYTSCPRDGSNDPAWLLSTDQVTFDFAKSEGVAKGAVLTFYGVPILASPSLSFPLSDERKSGWLPPRFGLDNKSGLELAVPYYWNIAPNRDATLTPQLISKRGLGLGTEFRYLEPRYEGLIDLNLLPDDKLADRSRSAVFIDHKGLPTRDDYYSIKLARVSDDDYWKDFPHLLDTVTPRLLAADLRAAHDFGDWTTYARVMRWQVLQDAVEASQILPAPYDRLPQLGARGVHRFGSGIEVGLETEFNRFDNPDGYLAKDPVTFQPTTRPTGSRVHALGSLSWPYVTPGWTLVPKLSVNAASYALDEPLPSGSFAGKTNLSRSIPSFSLDSAWVLERETNWFGHTLRQTLEPRLFYVKTAYRDQADMPNFDSAEKDFNFDSIYTENTFSGVDRVSDGHQVTAGVTSRFINPATGLEALRLGIAQRFLLEDQQITGDGEPDTKKVSDLLIAGSSSLGSKWKLDAGLQYSTDLERTIRSLLGARYSPGPYRTLSATYRFKRGESEQVDLGWQWPIYGTRSAPVASATRCAGAWYSVGRISYNLLDSRITDSVVGFEYDSGCWIGRVVAKRLSTGQQEATTQLGFELELVGLSRLGTNALGVLKDNIPGYRLLRDDPASATASQTPLP